MDGTIVVAALLLNPRAARRREAEAHARALEENNDTKTLEEKNDTKSNSEITSHVSPSDALVDREEKT
jgi:hypothetical protein